ncbi:hypothetical protein ABIA69_003926 [Lysinibacillus parviboronicapiens]|uniref:Uncharacterized protein n=1 Tax=Lysinibacillus parviboronicapiens TaxID=436516 RepID=A0ABV2PP51_9BACI
MIGGPKLFSKEFKVQIMQDFRNMIREEMTATLLESNMQLQQLPPFLTKTELKELLRIGDTKGFVMKC